MNSSETAIKAFRGSILHFTDDPDATGPEEAVHYFEDGLLLVENGCITSAGEYENLKQTLSPETPITDHSGKLIIPGFVDTHVHYPQTDMIASYGKQLLEWLDNYAFPREGMFTDRTYAADVADFFLAELSRNGTTTTQVMGTVHQSSAEILFEKALEQNRRLITGKTMMNCNAPDYLLDDTETGFQQSLELLEKWHGRGRLSYAVTPRFAVTSTESQLEKAAELLNSHMGLYLHTHLSENKKETELVKQLFPWCRDYLDVYDRFELVGPRSTFAHSIHLSDDEISRMATAGAAVSFCPSSNLFIGSGLFDLQRVSEAGIPIGMGSDVGGGTSFSILKTLAEAYKVLQLQGQSLSPMKAFYLGTLGGARALGLDTKIGSFQTGREADFTVLNFKGTPLIERRISHTETLEERLFVLMMLGDDRCISNTYLMGEPCL